MNIEKSLFWAIILGLVGILCIPFIISGSMLFPFITGKGFAFRIITEVIFGLYIILASLNASYRPTWSSISKSVLVFLGAILLADSIGVYPYKSFWSNFERMEGFVLLAHLGMYFFVLAHTLNTRQWWDRFWNASLIASMCMSFYGFLQMAGFKTINQGGVRVDGTFGNSTYLAIYLVFNIFIGLIYSYTSKETWKKVLYVLSIVINAIVLYATATRGSILGLFVGLIVTAIVIFWKERADVRVRKYATYSISFVAVVVLGFIFLQSTSLVKNSPVLSRFAPDQLFEIKTQGRYFVWPMALKGFSEKPVFGWGQENFNYVFNKYYDPGMYAQEQWFDRTHNVVLDWLIAGGLVGFAAYASMFIALLWVLWKKSQMSTAEKALITGLVSAYVFHNLFVFDNLISYVYFFSILAYIHSVTSERKDTVAVQPTTTSKDTIYYIAIPLVVVGTVFTIYMVNIPAMQTARAIIDGIDRRKDLKDNIASLKKAFEYNSFGSSEALEQLVPFSVQVGNNASVPANIKKDLYDFTTEKVEEKIKQTPNDARYQLFAGSYFNSRNQPDLALPYVQKAIELSPRKPAMYFELANSYLAKGDVEGAFKQFEVGYNLEPRYREGQILYALGAIYAGKDDIATKMFNTLGTDTVISDNRILNAFAARKDYNVVIQILTARIQKNPKNAEAKFNLASVYATVGQKQMAITLIKELIADYPDWKNQGEAYIKELSK